MIARAGMLIAVAGMWAWPSLSQSARRNPSPPVVTSVFPPGGKVGTTVEWRFAGRGLTKVRQVLVSGGGVKSSGFEAVDDAHAVATVEIERDAEPGFRELRLEGPDGVSNLMIVRLDTLPQEAETEPNDAAGEAQKIAVGSAVAGTIRATDVDHFQIDGRPGQEITLDLEARRVGTSITPVLSVLNGRGLSIAQARESRSSDHDCRLAVKIPKDGVLIAQIRDNTYAGGDSATYRLRVATTPYATGLYPLGGPRGKPLTVTAMGGSLTAPISKRVNLPDTPGVTIDPGPFESPEGLIDAPMRLMVGEANEFREYRPGAVPGALQPWPKTPDMEFLPDPPYSILVGEACNGAIGRPGEVDRYRMTVKKGDKFRVRIVAEPMGSWIDSVLTIRGAAGEMLAENDDSSVTNESPNRRGVNFLGVDQGTSDSLIDFEAPTDGPIMIELADRYGDGGPEYGYRLSVGASRPDFEAFVLIGNPNANGQVATAVNNRTVTLTPGLFGVYNLTPGAKVIVNVLAVPQGRPGPVTIRAEGLPDGVTAKPLTLDVLGPGPRGGSPSLVNAPGKAGNLVLEIAPYAEPGVSEFRIVATAEPEQGKPIARTASATIGLEAVASAVPARPITRRIERFPLRIVGEARRGIVGPPQESRLVLVNAPGVLLQGDRIELGLRFNQSPLPDPGFKFEAKARGPGLATNTVIASAALTDSDEERPGDVLVRVLAAANAVPGVHPVLISYAMTGGRTQTAEAVVIVRPPASLVNRAETIALKPGGSAGLWVGVCREVGCLEEVEVHVKGLPQGVTLAGPLTLKEGETEGVLRLEMAPTALPLTSATAVRVVASVRMPRGVVAIESRNRPMIVAGSAE
jgi:hypothetical protein